MHARPIGVEDSCNLDAQAMLAKIIEKEGFSAALAFIVTRPRTDAVHVSPIFLDLRVHLGIAVNFAGRGLKNLCLYALGQPQRVDRAMYRGFRSLYRVALIVNRRRGTRQIVDFVSF